MEKFTIEQLHLRITAVSNFLQLQRNIQTLPIIKIPHFDKRAELIFGEISTYYPNETIIESINSLTN